jgi:hypothetical protein
MDNSYVYNSGGGDTAYNSALSKFLPSALGPSRKTQKFIDKIAPNLKENDHYN